MPIYEYLCPECNRVYSFLVQRPDPERHPVCPKCGAADLRKQVSRFAFKRSGEAAAKGDDAGGYPAGDGFGDEGGWGEGGQWDESFKYFDGAWTRVLANLQKRFAEGPIDWTAFLKSMKAYQDAEDAKAAKK